jgi:serine/threonine-protein kinase
LAAEVSVERFRREIQFAAQLQHPLIVPSSATAGALLYYTMPFVAGESLRARCTAMERFRWATHSHLA